MPARDSLYWFVPDPSSPNGRPRESEKRFATAVRMIGNGQYAAALPLLDGADLAASPLAAYARYYTGVALQAMSRYPEADAAFAAALRARPEGYLREAVPLRIADTAIGRQDARRAAETLKDLSEDKVSAPKTC